MTRAGSAREPVEHGPDPLGAEAHGLRPLEPPRPELVDRLRRVAPGTGGMAGDVSRPGPSEPARRQVLGDGGGTARKGPACVDADPGHIGAPLA